jgi:glycosyltransferase involved in cell wall biosynthesis
VKILYISSLYHPVVVGGAERVLQAQAEAMQRAGHDVLVLCTSPEAGLRKDSVNGIRVWRAGLKNIYFPHDSQRLKPPVAVARQAWHLLDVYNIFMTSAIREAVKEFSPEVASIHNLAGWSVAAWDTLHSLRVPIVQVLHDQYLLCPTTAMFRDGQRCETQCRKCRLMRIPHRSKSRKVDTVVGVSRSICEKLKQFGYFQGVRRIEAIHNACDVSGEALPVAPRSEDGFTIFGYIGRLAPNKGIEFFLKTFNSIPRPDWKLLIAGTAEPQYQSFLKREYLSPRVQFLGHVPAFDFLNRIDCTVIPSLWDEALGNVVFESLLCGRPILGSRVGGIPEMIDSSNGLLFRAGDARELADALAWASEKRIQLRMAFAQFQINARKYADMDAWIRRWSDVYADAVGMTHSSAMVSFA